MQLYFILFLTFFKVRIEIILILIWIRYEIRSLMLRILKGKATPSVSNMQIYFILFLIFFNQAF
jgi:hypothetical protein